LGPENPAYDWETDFRGALRTIKPKLNRVLVDLRLAGRELRTNSAPERIATRTTTVRAVKTALGILDADSLIAAVFADTRTPADFHARAEALLDRNESDTGTARDSLSALAGYVQGALSTPLEKARRDLNTALHSPRTASPATRLANLVMRTFRDA